MWGGMLGNKRQDRGKKKFRGPEIFGGDFLGKCQKRGGKTFWRFQKVVGIFWGVVYSTGGILWKIVKKKFRGDFLGGVVYKGTCVGECWEIKDKIGKKNFRGPEIWGGTFGGNAKKGVEKLFWGECWGSCEPQQILGENFWKNVKEKNLGGNFGG